MLRTEEEARKKACPQLPADKEAEHVDGMSFHRVRAFPTCIASQCMWWRTTTQRGPNVVERARYETSAVGFDGFDQQTREWLKYERIAVGWCGIAGKPEAA